MTSEFRTKPDAQANMMHQAEPVLGEEKQIVETTVEARQGYLGRRVLLILSASMALALIAGFFLLGAV